MASGFAEVVEIFVQAGVNHGFGLVRAPRLADFGKFVAFQLLIHLEEVAHLLKNVGRQLGDAFIAVVGGVVKGDGDDFFILFAAVVHNNDADGITAHQGHGNDVLRAEHQHVQGVPVVGVGAGDEPIVGRVMGSLRDVASSPLRRHSFTQRLVCFYLALEPRPECFRFIFGFRRPTQRPLHLPVLCCQEF